MSAGLFFGCTETYVHLVGQRHINGGVYMYRVTYQYRDEHWDATALPEFDSETAAMKFVQELKDGQQGFDYPDYPGIEGSEIVIEEVQVVSRKVVMMPDIDFGWGVTRYDYPMKRRHMLELLQSYGDEFVITVEEEGDEIHIRWDLYQCNESFCDHWEHRHDWVVHSESHYSWDCDYSRIRAAAEYEADRLRKRRALDMEWYLDFEGMFDKSAAA